MVLKKCRANVTPKHSLFVVLDVGSTSYKGRGAVSASTKKERGARISGPPFRSKMDGDISAVF